MWLPGAARSGEEHCERNGKATIRRAADCQCRFPITTTAYFEVLRNVNSSERRTRFSLAGHLRGCSEPRRSAHPPQIQETSGAGGCFAPSTDRPSHRPCSPAGEGTHGACGRRSLRSQPPFSLYAYAVTADVGNILSDHPSTWLL